MAASLFTFNKNYEANMNTYYIDSYVNEYEKNRKSDNTFSSQDNTDFIIDSYDIQISKNNVFKVDVSLKKIKKKNIRFYINDAFTISNVASNNFALPFKQKENTRCSIDLWTQLG